MLKTQKTERTPRQTQWKKTYHSPLIHKVTNLFKGTELNMAFWTCNIIHNQLYDRIPLSIISSSGIYRLRCKTRNNSYVDHTGRMIEVGHLQNTRYITTNNSILAFALHILNKRYEYRNPEQTIQLLKPCNKGKKMPCWESFYTQVLQQQNLLINEQKINEPNSLYSLANVTRQHVI